MSKKKFLNLYDSIVNEAVVGTKRRRKEEADDPRQMDLPMDQGGVPEETKKKQLEEIEDKIKSNASDVEILQLIKQASASFPKKEDLPSHLQKALDDRNIDPYPSRKGKKQTVKKETDTPKGKSKKAADKPEREKRLEYIKKEQGKKNYNFQSLAKQLVAKPTAKSKPDDVEYEIKRLDDPMDKLTTIFIIKRLKNEIKKPEDLGDILEFGDDQLDKEIDKYHEAYRDALERVISPQAPQAPSQTETKDTEEVEKKDDQKEAMADRLKELQEFLAKNNELLLKYKRQIDEGDPNEKKEVIKYIESFIDGKSLKLKDESKEIDFRGSIGFFRNKNLLTDVKKMKQILEIETTSLIADANTLLQEIKEDLPEETEQTPENKYGFFIPEFGEEAMWDYERDTLELIKQKWDSEVFKWIKRNGPRIIQITIPGAAMVQQGIRSVKDVVDYFSKQGVLNVIKVNGGSPSVNVGQIKNADTIIRSWLKAKHLPRTIEKMIKESLRVEKKAKKGGLTDGVFSDTEFWDNKKPDSEEKIRQLKFNKAQRAVTKSDFYFEPEWLYKMKKDVMDFQKNGIKQKINVNEQAKLFMHKDTYALIQSQKMLDEPHERNLLRVIARQFLSKDSNSKLGFDIK